MAAPAKSLTYGSYLRTAELLSLQHRLSDAHDELQFIVVHQVFELWFKLMLFELESVRDALDRDDLPTAVRLLRRVAEEEVGGVESPHAASGGPGGGAAGAL